MLRWLSSGIEEPSCIKETSQTFQHSATPLTQFIFHSGSVNPKQLYQDKNHLTWAAFLTSLNGGNDACYPPKSFHWCQIDPYQRHGPLKCIYIRALANNATAWARLLDAAMTVRRKHVGIFRWNFPRSNDTFPDLKISKPFPFIQNTRYFSDALSFKKCIGDTGVSWSQKHGIRDYVNKLKPPQVR